MKYLNAMIYCQDGKVNTASDAAAYSRMHLFNVYFNPIVKACVELDVEEGSSLGSKPIQVLNVQLRLLLSNLLKKEDRITEAELKILLPRRLL